MDNIAVTDAHRYAEKDPEQRPDTKKSGDDVNVVPVLGQIDSNTEDIDRLARALVEQAYITPSSGGPRKTTKLSEIYAYYLFYIGNGGICPFFYAPTQFQNLVYLASDANGNVPFAGGLRSVASVVLIASGCSFAIQTTIFLLTGSLADYGVWRKYIVLLWTVISYGIGFAWAGVRFPDQWPTAFGLTVAGNVAYNLANVYFIAAHPGLARDTPEMQESEKAVLEGRKSARQHAQADVDARNNISNMSYVWLSFGCAILLVISIGIIKASHTYESTQNNTNAYSWLCVYGTGAWMLLAIPWQILEQKRPGQALPPGTSYFTVGFKNAWVAFKAMRQLKQTMIYFAANFILWDVVNTHILLTGILQNEVIEYEINSYNYLTILTYGAEGVGILVFWYIQRRFHLQTKFLIYIMCTWLVLFELWGVIGIWTTKIGYHHAWEFYLLNSINGFSAASWYQLSFTMIGDVVPVTKIFLFFSLFGISGKASGFVGPFATAAIIDDAGGNTNAGFGFSLPMAILGFVLMYFVDVDKSKIECRKFIEEEARQAYGMGSIKPIEGKRDA